MDTHARLGTPKKNGEEGRDRSHEEAAESTARLARFEDEVQERPEAVEAQEFSKFVEEINAPFREFLTKKYVDTRRKLIARCRSKFEEEVEEFTRQLAAKERELKLVRAEAHMKELQRHRLERKLENVLGLLWRKSDEILRHRIVKQYMQEWRSKTAFYDQSSWKVYRASQLCTALRLKAVFRAWLCYAQFSRSSYGEGEASARHETAIQCMKERIRSSRDKLEQFSRNVEGVEEEEKRDFMRGMCKLNLEALRIIKH